LDSCYVSSEFPLFRPAERAITQFLFLWFRLNTTLAEVESLCSGSTPLTRNRLKEERFLALEIPLPPADEQRRIVARVDAIADRIAEARQLREEIVADFRHLARSMLFGPEGSAPTRMSELVTLRPPDVVVKPEDEYHFAGVYCFGKGAFVGQRRRGNEFQYSKLTRLRKGDFVYPKLMAWEGAFAAVPPEPRGRRAWAPCSRRRPPDPSRTGP
jgi:type I restriction enzyme, S subunit